MTIMSANITPTTIPAVLLFKVENLSDVLGPSAMVSAFVNKIEIDERIN